jgi:hypothetical protein
MIVMNKIYIINKINNTFKAFGTPEQACSYLLGENVYDNIVIISNVDRDYITPVDSFMEKTVQNKNKLEIGQTWCEDIDDPFIVKRHARIDDIKDGYIKYHASYKSTMDNSNTYSCSEHTFKNYYPKKVE